jgi:hypothetical protein
MTLEEVTGETRRLTNKSSRYDDWMPGFSAGENYVCFVRRDEFADPHTFRFCRVSVAGGEADVEPLSDPSVNILWYDLFSDGRRALVTYYEDETYKTRYLRPVYEFNNRAGARQGLRQRFSAPDRRLR